MDLFSLPFVADPAGCSREGAEKALPKAGTQLAVIYALIADDGPLSDHQIAERTGYALSVAVARRNELVKRGLVRSVGAAIGSRGVRNNLWSVVRVNEATPVAEVLPERLERRP